MRCANMGSLLLQEASRQPSFWNLRLSRRHSRASGARGYAPEIDRRSANLSFLLGRPVAHVKSVGHDSRARLQLFHELRLELFIETRQEVKRDHRGLADVGF